MRKWIGAAIGAVACTSPATAQVGMVKQTMSPAMLKELSVPPLVDVTITVMGNGGVRWGAALCAPTANQIGTECTRKVAADVPVTFMPAPRPGARFVGWGGLCSGSARCTLKLTKPGKIMAQFEPAPPEPPTQMVKLSVYPNGLGGGRIFPTGFSSAAIDCKKAAGGSVSGSCTAQVPAGTKVILTGEAEPGSTFEGFSVGNCWKQTTCTVTAATGNSVFADFDTKKRVLTYTMTLPGLSTTKIITSDYADWVSSLCSFAEKGSLAVATCKLKVTAGSEQRLSVLHAALGLQKYWMEGSQFVSGCDRVEGHECVVKMDADRTVVAK